MRTALAILVALLICVGARGEPAAPLGLGRGVGPDEVAAWDIDVGPDGRGLPAGSGSVAEGEALYLAGCVACHGEAGSGGSFEALSGRIPGDAFPFGREPGAVKTIGSYWPYATTLFDYINRAMPYDAPGSLAANEVYSLVAYLLFLNDILAADGVVSRQSLADIRMPARDRFVPDNRRGGAEIR